MNFKIVVGVILVQSLAILFLQAASGENRIATLIGNNNYVNVRHVPTAEKGSKELAERLKNLGFSVDLIIDGNLQTLNQAIGRLKDASASAEVIFFYYAGHGVQLNGQNYLVPVESKFTISNNVVVDAISMSDVYMAMKGNSKKIVILDACRNPYDDNENNLWLPGLAVPKDVPKNALIAYATDPGKKAADPPYTYDYSVYTSALIDSIEEPGISIRNLFARIRDDVKKSSQGHQQPWQSDSFGEAPFYLRNPASIDLELLTADDFVLMTINGKEVLSGELNEQLPRKKVVLDAGDNEFTIYVYNQKTYENQNAFIGIKEGWKYDLKIWSSDSQQELYHFSGGEDHPEDSRWGRIFQVATGDLVVDKHSGKVEIVNINNRPYEPTDLQSSTKALQPSSSSFSNQNFPCFRASITQGAGCTDDKRKILAIHRSSNKKSCHPRVSSSLSIKPHDHSQERKDLFSKPASPFRQQKSFGYS